MAIGTQHRYVYKKCPWQCSDGSLIPIALILFHHLWLPIGRWSPRKPRTRKYSKKHSFIQRLGFWLNLLIWRYRTLSNHLEKEPVLKAHANQANVIRQIDIHTVPVRKVYQRLSTSLTLGLESPAVDRLTKAFGKNVISPPKNQYWKKSLNYIFGGFNFLMWIAFIATLVGLPAFLP